METIDVRIIKAGDGKYLTNGEIICKVIQLAPSASPDDWREITDAEKAEIERKMQEQAEEELQRHSLHND